MADSVSNKFGVESSVWNQLSAEEKREMNRAIESCVQDEKAGDGREESEAIAVCKDAIVTENQIG